MKTSINGREAEWSEEIRDRWDSTELNRAEGVITSANWYTARPYQDEYSTGSTKEGFVYTAKQGYDFQVYSVEWHVGKPDEAYIEPRATL